MELYKQKLRECYTKNAWPYDIIHKCINVLGSSSEDTDLFHFARNKHNLFIILENAYIHKYGSYMILTGHEFNVIYCIVEKYNMCFAKCNSINIILEMIYSIIMYPEYIIIYDDFYTNCLKIII